jgi:steroid delta-isomerase-like uncharacterized protein
MSGGKAKRRKEGTSMTPTTGADLVRSLTDAWNSHDAARLGTLYTQEATLLDPFYPEPLEGQRAIVTDAAEFFVAFPDLVFRPTKVIADSTTIVVEVLASGTNTGPLPLPTGPIPATNRPLEFSVASVLDLDATGKIREERRYFDVAGLLAQLGLMQ